MDLAMRVAGMGSMRSSINMLGPGAPTQAQNTHSPHKLIPPPGHHPRTELPVAGGTKSWAAVEVGGYRARQVPGMSAADVEGGNDRAVGVAGLSS